MNSELLTEHIFHVKFETQNELAKTFVRFQEHYESPEFRGKFFTLEEFKEWYIANSAEGKRTGEFTYYQDWHGFNIPSEILEPFYQSEFDPLSSEERQLLDLFKDRRGERFYIIGTHGDKDIATLRHEIAHGLFYTNPEYKREVMKILDEVDTEIRMEINTYFQTRGAYHRYVWVDETHGHIMTYPDVLERNGIDISPILHINKKLNLLFDKYFKSK